MLSPGTFSRPGGGAPRRGSENAATSPRIAKMKIQLSSPQVLTVQNIGDVMYGPMPQRADVSDCITAANNVYWRACRDLDNAVLRMENKLG